MEWATSPCIHHAAVPHSGLAALGLVVGQHEHPPWHALWLTPIEGDEARHTLIQFAKWLRGQLDHAVPPLEFAQSLVAAGAFPSLAFSVHDALEWLERCASFPEGYGCRGERHEWVSTGPIAAVVYAATRASVMEEGDVWKYPMAMWDPTVYGMAALVPSRSDRDVPLLYAFAKSGAHVYVYPSPVDAQSIEARMRSLVTFLDDASLVEDLVVAVETVFPSLSLSMVSMSGVRYPNWVQAAVQDLRTRLHNDTTLHTMYTRLWLRVWAMAEVHIDASDAERLYAAEYLRVRLLESVYLLGLPRHLEARATHDAEELRTELKEVHAAVQAQANTWDWVGSRQLTCVTHPIQWFPGAIRAFGRRIASGVYVEYDAVGSSVCARIQNLPCSLFVNAVGKLCRRP